MSQSSPTRKPKRETTPRETALGCAILAAILVACGLLGHAALTSSSSASSTTTISATPTSPATSTSALISGPTLGGTEGDFDTAPALIRDPSGQLWTYDATIAGIPVLVAPVPSNRSQSADGVARALIINLTPPLDQAGTASWTSAQAAQIAAAFLPPDATPMRIVSPDANGHTDHILLSHQLATTFVTSAFTNDAGTQAVPPGTLYWSCDTPVGNPSCYIAVGTN